MFPYFLVIFGLLSFQQETKAIEDFILIECDSGFSNRLRLLATFMFLRKVVFTNVSNVVMVWDVNESCRGHFLQTFQAVKGVVFISSHERKLFERFAIKSYFNTDAPIQKVLSWHNISLSDDEVIELQRSTYSQFVPVEDIKKAVSEFVHKYHICEASAIHIRRTDMDAHPVFLHKYTRNHTSDDDFIAFIESLPPEEKIFLLTDNFRTQNSLIERFGPDKILVYHKITQHTTNLHYNLHHRFTFFRTTVMDILIAVHGKRFKGTFFSSMSDLISVLRGINGARRVCTQSMPESHQETFTVDALDRVQPWNK